MAVRAFTLPVCDQCGEPWFPDKGPMREDIRAFDAKQRALGTAGKPVRCGKCKSPNWDKIFREKGENGPAEAEIVPEVTKEDVFQTLDVPEIPAELFKYAEDLKAGAERISGGRRLCRHRLLNCPECFDRLPK